MNLSSCDICPRKCKVNRLQGEKGICQVTGENVFLARAALHFYEEPCISGTNGSGAVFFCGCNLHCVYCQNQDISSMKEKMEVSVERLSEIFLELQEKKAHNINLVTPTHYSYQIREAILLSRENGLQIPIVYNCSGYESVQTLKELEDVIDIYLTDFKYADSTLSKSFSFAKDYESVAMDALCEMVRQKKEPVFSSDGMMQSGVIVRNLLLPGHVKNSKEVVRKISEVCGNQVIFSLMNQYTPLRTLKYEELNRKVTKREYERFISYVLSLGIENAFIQEGETARESFIPAFNFEGVLKEER